MIDDCEWFRQRGVLPVAGGALEQPPRFIDSIAVVEGVIAALKSEEDERAKQQQG